MFVFVLFFSSRSRHTRFSRDWSSDVCSSDLERVGYLMRTTAVYGGGKFGLSDRERIANRPEFAGPFSAEMLAIWLIRAFTVDLRSEERRVGKEGRARGGRLVS